MLHKIELFVFRMYYKPCTLSKINEARKWKFAQKYLFAKFGGTIDNIQLTQYTLIPHLENTEEDKRISKI